MSRAYRFRFVPEDADDGCMMLVPVETTSLEDRKYLDRKPWRCGECGQPQEPEWTTCVYCGRWREDCEL